MMLVLARKKGQKIRIGDTVTLTVIGTEGTQVIFGIDAPKDVAVHREEVYKEILAQSGENPAS